MAPCNALDRRADPAGQSERTDEAQTWTRISVRPERRRGGVGCPRKAEPLSGPDRNPISSGPEKKGPTPALLVTDFLLSSGRARRRYHRTVDGRHCATGSRKYWGSKAALVGGTLHSGLGRWDLSRHSSWRRSCRPPRSPHGSLGRWDLGTRAGGAAASSLRSSAAAGLLDPCSGAWRRRCGTSGRGGHGSVPGCILHVLETGCAWSPRPRQRGSGDAVTGSSGEGRTWPRSSRPWQPRGQQGGMLSVREAGCARSS